MYVNRWVLLIICYFLLQEAEAAKNSETGDEAEYKLLPSGPANGTEKDAKVTSEREVTFPNCERIILCFSWFHNSKKSHVILGSFHGECLLEGIRTPLFCLDCISSAANWEGFHFLSFWWCCNFVIFLVSVNLCRNMLTHWPCVFEIDLHSYLFGVVLGGEFIAGLYLVMSKLCLKQTSKDHEVVLPIPLWTLVFVLQIPVSVGVSSFEAISLYKGWRKIQSKGEDGTNFRVMQLIVYCFFGILAGLVGGLLGLGGGFIMGPLFLELGVPPQVSLCAVVRDHLYIFLFYSHLNMQKCYWPFVVFILVFLLLGLKCHCHFCDDVLLINVRGGVLPSKTFPSSLWYVAIPLS